MIVVHVDITRLCQKNLNNMNNELKSNSPGVENVHMLQDLRNGDALMCQKRNEKRVTV